MKSKSEKPSKIEDTVRLIANNAINNDEKRCQNNIEKIERKLLECGFPATVVTIENGNRNEYAVHSKFSEEQNLLCKLNNGMVEIECIH